MHQAILVPTMGASLASDTGRLPCVPSKRRPPRGNRAKPRPASSSAPVT